MRAEIRCGDILAKQKKTGQRASDGNPKQRLQRATVAPPTLKEMGIEKSQASRWRLGQRRP